MSNISYLSVMSVFSFLLSTSVFSMGQAPAKPGTPELETVPFVDLQQYMGKWYEIASFPQSFQKNCTATSAEYSLNENGTVKVLNSCRLFNPKGELKVANGSARVADASTNAKLKVSFFWPFEGDYWVIDLASDYSYAVVGAPGRDYLWILSREKRMDESTFQEILLRLTEKSFDISRLQKTVH